jgi:hypothetical protein
MNSMTRLAFLVVFILMVTASIVFHKSHSASAEEPTPLRQYCVLVGDHELMQQDSDECDSFAQDQDCSAGFIRPINSHDLDAGLPSCTACLTSGCWECFGVNCQ